MALSKRWRGKRIFGWLVYGAVPDEHEAEAIREAAQQVIDGSATTADIARAWTARPDLLTTQGAARWYLNVTEQVLRRTSNVPSILDADTYERLMTVLDRPGRRSLAQPRSTYQPLGRGTTVSSGVAVCALCGCTLIRKHEVLACARRARGGHADHQRHPTVAVEQVEQALVGATVGALADMLRLPPEDARSRLEAMTMAEKRTLARSLFSVVVSPSGKKTLGVFSITRRLS